MNRKVMFRFWLVVVIVALGLLPTISLQAQEPGLTEAFDDPTLPGWEYTPNATVMDGVLRLEPGGFAFHPGEWGDQTLTVRVRRSGEGELVISYRAGDAGTYHVVLGGDFLVLQREAGGAVAELGAAAPLSIPTGEWFQLGVSVTGGEHKLTLDPSAGSGQALVLTATDPDPLPAGGVAFEILGEAIAEFDDLALTGVGEAPPPVETGPMPKATPEAAAPVPPATGLTWVRTGGPPGGLGYDIRYNFADPNTWYVTDNFAGVHISTDNGLTWQPSNTGIPPQFGPSDDWIPIFCLTVDPHNPQTVWAGTDKTGHIYKSSDGGRAWTQMDNGVDDFLEGVTFRGFTVDPRSSDIVYAAGEVGSPGWAGEDRPGREFDMVQGFVYKTTDGGQNWDLIWNGNNLARYVWIDPRDPNVIYVSTGIFDREAANSVPDSMVPGGVGIVKSADGGQTWQEITNGLNNLYVGTLFMHPDDPDILLAGTGNNQYHEATGVYRTADGGETWTHVLDTSQPEGGEVITSVELCPSDPNIGYAGGANIVCRTEDAGQAWELVSGGMAGWGPPGVMAGWPIDMQCDPYDPNRVFANNYNGGNFLSEDGGRTWQNASDGYTGAQTRGISVDPTSPGRVYVAGRSGIWRSDTGGASWYGLYYPPADNPIFGLEWQAIAVDPSQPNHVLAGNIVGAVIMESEDGGLSWQVRWSLEQVSDELPPDIDGPAPDAIVFAPSDPATVYASICFDGCVMGHEPTRCDEPSIGVIVSHDGGTTWQRAVDDQFRDVGVLDLAVDPTDSQIVYAAAPTGLFQTTDGGGTWMPLTGFPAGQVVRTVAVSPDDPQHVLVGLEGIGVYVSTDGGGTWQSGVGGLEANCSLHEIVFDPTNTQVVYTSDYFSGVYRSTNGGLTWTQVSNGLRIRSAMGLSISSDGQRLYVATNGEGVYRLDLSGQPPQPVPGATPAIPSTPTSVAAPTAPPEAIPTLTPEPSGGRGLCGGAAVLPVVLLGLAVRLSSPESWGRRKG